MDRDGDGTHHAELETSNSSGAIPAGGGWGDASVSAVAIPETRAVYPQQQQLQRWYLVIYSGRRNCLVDEEIGSFRRA